MLQAIDLSCVRGDRRLFQGLSFAVAAGEALRIRGDNGVGKTSLLRILAGLSPATAGAVRWRGRDLKRGDEDFSRDLVFIGHANALKDDLTAVENLLAAATLSGLDVDERAVRDSLALEGLEEASDLPVQWLSQGQKRRAALARLGQSGSRALWILDEPFSALDRPAVDRLCARIGAHVSRGGVVVLTTHQDVELGVAMQSLELS
jgi:heme exporter protein A